MLPQYEPMQLGVLQKPVNSADVLVELKYDGFSGLAYIENGKARLVSKKGTRYQKFETLCRELAKLPCENAVLHGEIVSLDDKGKPQFHNLIKGTGTLCFYAFDLLHLDGKSITGWPLIERKQCLEQQLHFLPTDSTIRFSSHFPGHHMVDVFHLACREDLEGLVVKLRESPYDTRRYQRKLWAKLKNPAYSQEEFKQRLFQHRN